MITLFILSQVFASICTSWKAPVELGLLPVDKIPESSGMQVSRKMKDRVYHVNDSGDGPFFYITNLKGEGLQTVEVDGMHPLDVEDMGIVSIDEKDHIVIGDIGDNLKIRKNISFYFIEEAEKFSAKVKPAHVLHVTYPDGNSYNSEAFAFHPNGDLYLFTKVENIITNKAFPFQVYRLPKAAYINKHDTYTLDLVSEVNLPKLFLRDGWLGQVVTAMDFDRHGNWILLTYKKALYSNLDITKPLPPIESWQLNKDYSVVTLADFPQQEAISFLPDKDVFIFSTEFRKKYKRAPISQVKCSSFRKQ